MEEPLSRRRWGGRLRTGRLWRGGRCSGSAGLLGGGRAAGAVRRAVDVDAVRADLTRGSGLRSAGGGIELGRGSGADEVGRSSARAVPRKKRVQHDKSRVYHSRKGGSPRIRVVLASKRGASPEKSRLALRDIACKSSGGGGSAIFDEEL